MFKRTAPADIFSMNLEELEAHNKAAAKRVMIRTTIMAAVVVGIHVAAAALENHLDKKEAQAQQN